MKDIMDFIDAKDLVLNVSLVSGAWKRALLTIRPRKLIFHPGHPELKYPTIAIGIMCGRLPNVNSAIFYVGSSPRFNTQSCAYVITKIERYLKSLEINMIEDHESAYGHHREIQDGVNTLDHITDLGSLESFSFNANGKEFSYMCISNLLTRSKKLKTLRLNGCVMTEDDDLAGLVGNYCQSLNTLEFRTYSSWHHWTVNENPVPPSYLGLFTLMQMGSLATLRCLSLDYGELSDSCVRIISSMRLEHLSLGGFPNVAYVGGTSPAGLEHIHEMISLKTLALAGLPVCDLFVSGCSMLSSLHTLKLDSVATRIHAVL